MANLATISNNILADSGIDPINLIVGTGTVNYVPKFTGEDTLAISQIFDNGTNVGIGTASPISIGTGVTTLDIQGSAAGGLALGPSGIKNYIYGASTLYVEANTTAVFTTSGSEKMRITSAGNMGIGTTNPSQVLHVVGNARITGAYYDSNNSAGTSGQVLSSTGSGTDWVSLSEITGVDGTGTANYIAKWQDANTIQNSIIYDNGTNVGIGTAGPSYKLDIQAAAGVAIRVRNTFNTDDAYLLAQSTLGSALFGINAVGQYLYTGDAIPLLFYNSATERMRITATGNVGIGTTNPTDKLHVVGGDVRFAANTYVGGIINAYQGDASIWVPNVGQAFTIKQNTGNVGIGTTSPIYKLDITALGYGIQHYGNATNSLRTYAGSGYQVIEATTSTGVSQFGYFSGNFFVEAGGSERMRITSGGNVGIGTTSPSVKLEVVGGTINNQIARFITADFPTHSIGLGVDGAGSEWGASIFQDDVKRFTIDGNGGILVGSSYQSSNAPANGAIIQGNVGIGTTSPGTKLQVNSTAGTYGITNTNGTVTIGTYIEASNTYASFGTSSNHPIGFFTNNNAPQMYINTSGNVGIGTTSPARKLTVVSDNIGIRMDNSSNTNGGLEYFFNGSVYNWLVGAQYNVSNAFEITPSTAVGGTTYSTPAFLVNANGNVGIGTTSPGYKLDVIGSFSFTTGGNYLQYASGILYHGNYYQYPSGDNYLLYARTNGALIFGSNDTERMRITSGGNVGIGTTSPSAALNVVNSQRALAVYRISGTNRTTFYDDSFAVSTDGGGADGFIYGSNVGGSFPFNGYGEVIIQANPRTGYQNGISFVTGTTSPTVKMRLTEGGNVGIGTTSPGTKLSVYANNPTTGIIFEIYNNASSSHTGAIMKFTQDAVADWGIGQPAGTNAFAFWSGTYPGNLGTERMRITSGGNVLVNTTTTSDAKLDVYNDSSNYAAYFRANTLYAGGYRLMRWYMNGNSVMDITGDSSSISFNNNQSGFISFGTAGAERIRITSGGNVGIGTTNAVAKLTVAGSNNTAQGLIVTGADPNQGNVAKFARGDSEKNFYIGATNNAIVNLATEGSIHLKTNVTVDAPYTSGTTTMVLTSTGRVGIGTTTPATKLEVRSGSAGVEAARFSDSNYADLAIGFPTAGVASIDFEYGAAGDLAFRSGTGKNEKMRITNAGNVGIGTTSPTNKLTIQSNSTQLRLETASNPGAYYSFIESNYNAANPLNIYSSAAASYAMGTIALAGIDGVNTYLNSYYGIVFGTSSTLISSGTVRMMITNGGNVGIGTTTPLAYFDGGLASKTLQIVGSGRTGINIQDSSSINQYINIGVNGGNAFIEAIYSTTPTINYNAYSSHIFITGSTPSEKMRITSAGNVGIGTTSPSTKLHVSGGALITGGLDLNSGARITGAYYENSNTEYTYIDMYNPGNASINIGTKHPLSYISFESGNGAYTERMRITNTGNVGIGTSAPSYKLHVSGTIGLTDDLTLAQTNPQIKWSSGLLRFTSLGIGNVVFSIAEAGAATFTSSVTATGFFESSDARLKTIVNENYRLDSIVSIKPKFYEKNGKFEVGYIAQEVEQLYPHAVTVGADGYLSLSYSQVHTLKLAYLEDSIEEIKRKIAYLEQQLNNK
jgi:hypothetical protein